MFLNSLAVWSTVLKGRLCSTRKPEKKVQLLLLFAINLQSLSLHQDRLIFFVVVQHPRISCGLKFPCVNWYHFLPHVQHWNRFHTQHINQNFPHSWLYELIWIYYTTNRWISHNTPFSLSELVLNCVPSFLHCFDFFHGPILLCNNWKIGLKSIRCCLGGRKSKTEQKIWKSYYIWKFNPFMTEAIII